MQAVVADTGALQHGQQIGRALFQPVEHMGVGGTGGSIGKRHLGEQQAVGVEDEGILLGDGRKTGDLAIPQEDVRLSQTLPGQGPEKFSRLGRFEHPAAQQHVAGRQDLQHAFRGRDRPRQQQKQARTSQPLYPRHGHALHHDGPSLLSRTHVLFPLYAGAAGQTS